MGIRYIVDLRILKSSLQVLVLNISQSYQCLLWHKIIDLLGTLIQLQFLIVFLYVYCPKNLAEGRGFLQRKCLINSWNEASSPWTGHFLLSTHCKHLLLDMYGKMFQMEISCSFFQNFCICKYSYLNISQSYQCLLWHKIIDLLGLLLQLQFLIVFLYVHCPKNLAGGRSFLERKCLINSWNEASSPWTGHFLLSTRCKHLLLDMYGKNVSNGDIWLCFQELSYYSFLFRDETRLAIVLSFPGEKQCNLEAAKFTFYLDLSSRPPADYGEPPPPGPLSHIV